MGGTIGGKGKNSVVKGFVASAIQCSKVVIFYCYEQIWLNAEVVILFTVGRNNLMGSHNQQPTVFGGKYGLYQAFAKAFLSEGHSLVVLAQSRAKDFCRACCENILPEKKWA